jgi:hypothetical protein
MNLTCGWHAQVSSRFGSKHKTKWLQQQVTKNKVTATRICPYIAQHFYRFMSNPIFQFTWTWLPFNRHNPFLQTLGQFRRWSDLLHSRWPLCSVEIGLAYPVSTGSFQVERLIDDWSMELTHLHLVVCDHTSAESEMKLQVCGISCLHTMRPVTTFGKNTYLKKKNCPTWTWTKTDNVLLWQTTIWNTFWKHPLHIWPPNTTSFLPKEM